MSRARAWAGVLALGGLTLAAWPGAGHGPLAAPAQATEPYPTLVPTRPFPTLPSNVPPPLSPTPSATASPTPTHTEEPTATTGPRHTPTASASPTATEPPSPTRTSTATITATPSATRYLDLGRRLWLPYAAQFDARGGTTPPARARRAP